MSQPYSMAKHTIIPLVLKVITRNSISYLLRDPSTRQAILLPSMQHSQQDLESHVANIEQQFECNLTHTLLIHAEHDFKGVKGETVLTGPKQGDLRPLLVGDLSLCFIAAPGYSKDYSLLAATHITSTSTKLPVLFPGNLLSVCSVDLKSKTTAQQYLASIKRLKFFPTQTLLFPSQPASVSDLQFSSALEKSSFIDEKIKMLKQNPRLQDCLIPTSVMQEKLMNPFLAPQRHSSLLKATSPQACFDLLRKLRRQWQQ